MNDFNLSINSLSGHYGFNVVEEEAYPLKATEGNVLAWYCV